VDRLVRHRLLGQKLLHTDLSDSADIVAWLGAVQSQDFSAAKWALALRLRSGLTNDAIERAFNAGTILRTHVLRPTWHFVTPADIGWMLALTAPRVHQSSTHAHRQFELDSRTLTRARTIIARALADGSQLTRAELAAALRRGGITASGPRLGLLTIDVEINKIMCSGALRGRQHTYARFDSRVPETRPRTREESLAELTKRFFRSHGPATLRDFGWWSGLTMRQVKEGVELAKPELTLERVHDLEYWMGSYWMGSDPATGRLNPLSRRVRGSDPKAPVAHLLPNYDEYLIAYKDRGLVGASDLSAQEAYTHQVVVDGQFVGTWKPIAAKDGVRLDVKLRRALGSPQERALQRAVAGYGEFVGKAISTNL
jgi:Winged helix DNA-binding domain